MNPKGSSVNSHANLTHKLRVNEQYEKQINRLNESNQMLKDISQKLDSYEQLYGDVE